MKQTVAIILAAGVSSRMKTARVKVLHEVCGRPMLQYVLDACREAGVSKILVVVGYGSEQVQQHFSDEADIVWVVQQQQKGTAHAVLCCEEHLKDFDGQTLVLCGDGPLIRPETLNTLITKHQAGHSAAILATTVLDDPSGYGRILRDEYGNIQGIIEDSDGSPEQLEIKEVNPSYYLFDNKILFESLQQVKPNNVRNEYYLTDVLEVILSAGHRVEAITAVRPEEAVGINSRAQLSRVGKIMQQRIQQKLMTEGVTIVDPDNTWIDSRAKIGQDTVIEPFTYVHGRVRIGRDCRIGPFAYLDDGIVLEDGAVVEPGKTFTAG